MNRLDLASGGMFQNSTPEYVDKYGPLVHLLNSEYEMELLANADGYRKDFGDQYRHVRRMTLHGYLIDLREDFDRLYSEAVQYAIADRELADQLEDTRRTLRRAIRYIRMRLFMEQLLPAPHPKYHQGLLKRLFLRCIPGPVTPQTLLVSMDLIRTALSLKQA